MPSSASRDICERPTRSSRFRRSGALLALFVAVLLSIPVPAVAHIGSPDVYAEGSAGPYKLFVTVRPPQVIPGVAEIEVRAEGTGPNAPTISDIQIAPIPLYGEASKHPPVADAMKQSAQDKTFFTGALWIMASGSWQVRFTVNGNQGKAVLSIPVPATSSSTRGMQAGLGVLLGGLGLLLVAGVVGIVGAAVREAQVRPGEAATKSGQRHGRIAMAITLVVMIAAVVFGQLWWASEADDYARYVYKPLTLTATLSGDNVLHLQLQDPGWLKNRRIDDFVLDHDHLMHLYLIRQPGLDVVYHLHPELIAPGEFQLALPSIPAGNYSLYADVVHATGFPETLTARITLPPIHGRPLSGDDAKGTAEPATTNPGAANCTATAGAGSRFRLPDGYTMVWDNAATVAAKTPEVFQFSLLDGEGNPPADMAFYMGMPGHAAFVKYDGSVFAHVHPSGTISMAALNMAAAQNQPSEAKSSAMTDMPGMPTEEPTTSTSRTPRRVKTGDSQKHPALQTTPVKLPNSVGFPYGFPTAGAYRIFVQMKHGNVVETGAFDACATLPRAN